jgi:hypothetical protein
MFAVDVGQGFAFILVTSLMDLVTFPALLLAEQYHQRWEIENTIDELKTHLLGRKTPIRSLKPRVVVQEIFCGLIGHYAIRSLMVQAATVAHISPLRLSFTGTLRVIRRAVADFQDISPEQIPLFFSRLIHDILAEPIPPRQLRNNPRVVKKPRSKFSSKKPIHRATSSQVAPLIFSISNTA